MMGRSRYCWIVENCFETPTPGMWSFAHGFCDENSVDELVTFYGSALRRPWVAGHSVQVLVLALKVEPLT